MNIVGLDLETTSLAPEEGEIIEVAALRFDAATGEEVGRFVRLCAASKPLTQTVVSLTGITPDLLEGKPFFKDVKDELKEFIGDDSVLGHNVAFDIGWLKEHGLPLPNKVWDTFLLASVALPEVPSYNLGMLAALLQLPVTGEHRAEHDVRLSWKLLQALKEHLHIAPRYEPLFKGIVEHAGFSHVGSLFSVSAEKRSRKAVEAPRERLGSNSEVWPHEAAIPTRIQDVLGEGGSLAQELPEFSYRSEQEQMALEVERLFREEKIGLIEAGTGSGKTFAYLVPALQLLARQTDRPVIISTHTRYLQDQITRTDLPRLLTALGTVAWVAVLKGRRNYLCTTRLRRFIEAGKYSPDEAWLLLKILVWLSLGADGDLERLNISHQGARLLNLLHADALSCRLGCSRDGDCPYQAARARAEAADIIVVNHALLMQLALGEDTSLPLRYVIIDEAHHLPEAARFAAQVDLSSGRLGEVLAGFQQSVAKKSTASENSLTNTRLATEAEGLLNDYQRLLQDTGDCILTIGQGSTRLRISTDTRRNSSWAKLVKQVELWRARLTFLTGMARGATKTTKTRQQTLLSETIVAAERFSIELDTFFKGSSERIQWVEVRPSYAPQKPPTVLLRDIPLRIEPVLIGLFETAKSVVLTSATLTTGGTFAYIKNILGIQEASDLRLPSSYDYQKNMLIYIVEDAPDPKHYGFVNFIAGTLSDITSVTRGRLLALLTSHKVLKEVYFSLEKSLSKDKIKLLAQKMTGGRYAIIERFKSNPNSVVLGASSFWQGLDIPGEGLSVVVIPKLPFPTPDDPVTQAVAETLDNPFDSFRTLSLPLMLLRLRQGVGRLLRSADDRGVVVLLDSRFLASRYRDDVFKSFPTATVHIGSRGELTQKIRDWIGSEKIEQWRRSFEERTH